MENEDDQDLLKVDLKIASYFFLANLHLQHQFNIFTVIVSVIHCS
jgi:hypothetical protein